MALLSLDTLDRMSRRAAAAFSRRTALEDGRIASGLRLVAARKK